jgi:hypothetical protein
MSKDKEFVRALMRCPMDLTVSYSVYKRIMELAEEIERESMSKFIQPSWLPPIAVFDEFLIPVFKKNLTRLRMQGTIHNKVRVTLRAVVHDIEKLKLADQDVKSILSQKLEGVEYIERET